MMTQTIALLVDAYRELNAKRLFWVVLVLSGILVASMACVGVNEKGVTVLWWTLEIPLLNSTVITKPVFYKSFLFIPLGVTIWLSWAATILALISTASIIPDFISSGSIELSLSRPIGRLRLFLTKYLTGLLFVALQVTVFSLGAFLVIGIRGESWEPKLFIAVPLVVAFFSYLYSFCALMGLITRSTIASLLLTVLLWVVIFLVHLGETGIVLRLKETQLMRIELAQRAIDVDIPKRIADQEEKAKEPAAPAVTGDAEKDRKAQDEFERANRLAARAKERADKARQDLESMRTRLEKFKEDLPTYEQIHFWFFTAKTVLPKTSETIGLLEREMVSISDLQGMRDAQAARIEVSEEDEALNINDVTVAERMDKVLRARSVWWVIGTSLVFEGIVLGAAAWIFCRRDF
ncbi:MAG: hypothetical protein AMXMBFR58_03560 [Phycisphaerae bacterium]|nr:hypothetical protein [Phycisphaerales bacterium]MCK6476889.1 hypothetical protein [Phycisphaerales bacterium]